jgi:hypothetical protein
LVSFAVAVITAFVSLGGVLGSDVSITQSTANSWLVWLAVGLTVTALLGSVVTLSERWLRERRERDKVMIGRAIRANVDAEVDQSELKARVAATAGQVDDTLVNQLVEGYLFGAASELRKVEEVIAESPPQLPRAAKRTLNHARLVTRIARERGVFGGDPPVTPEHLGKWIVLSQRWTSLGRRLADEPSLMAEFEQRAREDLADALRWLDVPVRPTAELNAVIVATPQLSSVLPQLVYFEPASDDVSTATG